MKTNISYKRPLYERLGLFAVALLTVFGLSSLGADMPSKTVARQVVLTPSFNFLQVSERENETARIPVRFDIGLHSPTTSGH